MTEPIDTDKDIAETSRRRFLRDGGALVGGAVIAGGLGGSQALAAAANAGNLPPNVPEWMKTPGDPMGSQPYGTPSPFEKDVVKNIPKDLPQYLSASGRTPLQDLDGIITPNGLFYERHHAGVPRSIRRSTVSMLHGLVDKPLIFTMDDIRRFLRNRASFSNAPATRIQEALRQDRIRSCWSVELCRMDRGQPETRLQEADCSRARSGSSPKALMPQR
jgi:sulfane dehydrogenase subunit SoxC